MHKLISLIQRFGRDEGGAFAMIFAVIAIAVIAMSGAVVDFTGVQQARTRAQVSLDAAALALQPTIYNTGVTAQTIQPLAQAQLIQSLADAGTTWKSCTATAYEPPCATVATPVIDLANGQLTLSAQIEVQTNFVSLIGVQQIPSQLTSVATRKKLNLEVAMVLDNSGSMYYSIGYTKHVNDTLPTRMDTLHSAADCAANILFYGVTTCTASTTGLTVAPNVKMALVPFNDEVNVGTGNASATWLDRSGGASTFANDNFDNDDIGPTPYTGGYTGTMDRVSLFSSIKNKNGSPTNGVALSWGGCVEARYDDGATKFYDTDDTLPDPNDKQTMFTPLFAPDEPDSGGYDNNYISDTPAACNKTGVCSNSSSGKATYSDVTTIIVAKGTATVKKSNGSTVSTTNITSTFTTGPVSGTTSTSTTTANPTITAANGDTRSTSTICSCTGQTLLADNTTNSTPVTNGNVSKSGPSNSSSSIPGDTVLANTPVNGQTTTNHYTSATKEVDTQPMKYTASRAWSCNAPYAPWAVGSSGSTGGLTPRAMQERLCKYTGSQMTTAASLGFGPNIDCPASAIQPLTATPSALITAINNMQPDGNTNIQEGTAWGFRVLSPGAPFTEGLPYDQATSKVLIVMTDGENTYSSDNSMNGASLYAAYAYPWNNTWAQGLNRGRMGDTTWDDGDFETEINSRLSKTCTNAKKAGMTIYTIGLATANTSDPTGNKKLLTDCASDTGKAYFPTTASDLQNAFVSIANELAALRLSK